MSFCTPSLYVAPAASSACTKVMSAPTKYETACPPSAVGPGPPIVPRSRLRVPHPPAPPANAKMAVSATSIARGVTVREAIFEARVAGSRCIPRPTLGCVNDIRSITRPTARSGLDRRIDVGDDCSRMSRFVKPVPRELAPGADDAPPRERPDELRGLAVAAARGDADAAASLVIHVGSSM